MHDASFLDTKHWESNPHVQDARNNEEKVTNLDFPQTFLIVVLPLSSIQKNASKNNKKTTAIMPNFHK